MAVSREEFKERVVSMTKEREGLVATLNAQIETLRLMAVVVDKLPEPVSDEVWKWLDAMPRLAFSQSPRKADDEAVASPAAGRYYGTHLQKVIQFFIAHKNRPSTNMEIRRELGLTRGAVAVILYQKGSPFEKSPGEDEKKVRWRMRPERYEQAVRDQSPSLFELME